MLGDVTFRYVRGQPPLFAGLNMEIAGGTTVSLIGPSGSGKSTLLALLGGLLTPDSGTRSLDPPPGTSPPPVRWVPQTVNTLRGRSLLDNVVAGGFASGRSRTELEAEAHRLLGAVGLSDLEGRTARSVSGGELQRSVVARALIGAPALVLADEPTGQLDRQNTTMVAGTLLEARSTQTAVVIATHDPTVASMCDISFSVGEGGVTRIR